MDTAKTDLDATNVVVTDGPVDAPLSAQVSTDDKSASVDTAVAPQSAVVEDSVSKTADDVSVSTIADKTNAFSHEPASAGRPPLHALEMRDPPPLHGEYDPEILSLCNAADEDDVLLMRRLHTVVMDAFAQSRKRRRRENTCACGDCREDTPQRKKRVTRKTVEATVQTRICDGESKNKLLFRESERELLNAEGDMRYHDCVLLCDMGRFKAGSTVSIIDWVDTANVLLLNDTGRVADTCIVHVNPSTLADD